MPEPGAILPRLPILRALSIAVATFGWDDGEDGAGPDDLTFAAERQRAFADAVQELGYACTEVLAPTPASWNG